VNGDVVSLLRPCTMSVYACKSQTESDGDLLFEQRVLDLAELQDSQSTTGFQYPVSFFEDGLERGTVTDPEGDGVDVDRVVLDVSGEGLGVTVGEGDLGC
jgi:hypothetical protein